MPTFARTIRTAADIFALSVAYWLAFLLRFDWDLQRPMLARVGVTWPYVVAWQYALLVAFGITQFAWRYFGLRETVRVVNAIAIAAVGLVALRFAASLAASAVHEAEIALVPIGVTLINAPLAFLAVSGLRMLRRTQVERSARSDTAARTAASTAVPTILVGAGRAGVMVAREIAGRPDLGIAPIGFVDDDPTKLGTRIHGLRVLGTIADLKSVLDRHSASQALITIADAPGSAIRRISDACTSAGLQTKVLPGLYQVLDGSVNLSRMRSVALEDLLQREPVKLDADAIASFIAGRVVLVTGAGGSIGSELCRQLLKLDPATLLLVERSENSLFNIHRELSVGRSDDELVPCMADVCDTPRIVELFRRYRPEIVFHAAAHKHVPMMEWNSGEAVKNNVFGTKALADIAHQHGTSAFVMISTDKAVNPSSVMGVSKRIAEMYIQGLGFTSTTRFVTVRFGNVLGSAGSVVPIFQEQIAAGGPVTVTHPDMRRYFMTIPEASELVLQAATMGEGGEIFILDMGDPVRIMDVARDLIRLSGYDENEIPIEITGIRPGEKLCEDLSFDAERMSRTRHPKIHIGRTKVEDFESLCAQLERLIEALQSPRSERLRETLGVLVPEFSGTVPRDITVEQSKPAVSDPVQRLQPRAN